jgi:hypothetical protein
MVPAERPPKTQTVRLEEDQPSCASTVAGERGAADAERDVRGFALRFYTEEGNWDIIGNSFQKSS